jgi:hypothetical protein
LSNEVMASCIAADLRSARMPDLGPEEAASSAATYRIGWSAGCPDRDRDRLGGPRQRAILGAPEMI